VLTWTPPRNDVYGLGLQSTRAVVDYQIQFKLSSATTWTTLTRSGPSAAATATVSGLSNDATYLFRVAAVNGFGLGVYTPNVSAVPSLVASLRWTPSSIPPAISGGYNAVAAGTTGFVAVGTGRSAFSTDGVNWSVAQKPTVMDMLTWSIITASSTNWTAIACGANQFVGLSSTGSIISGQLANTNDKIDWSYSAITLLPASGTIWKAIAYGNGVFVAVGERYFGSQNIIVSTDGINWSGVNSTVFTPYNWPSKLTGITFGNGLFVATGNGVVVTAAPTNLNNWTIRPTATGDDWRAIAYNNGVFVAVGLNNFQPIVKTSPNAVAWTSRTLPASTLARPYVFSSIACSANSFIAISNESQLLVSSADGTIWDMQPTTVTTNWSAITAGNGTTTSKFVAVSTGYTTYNTMSAPV
jgi:hypothetical protein